MVEAGVKKSRYIFLFLRIAVVSGGILWGIFWISKGQRWINLKDIFLQKMNPWIFAVALGVFIFSQILVGLRWWLLLRTQSVFIGFWAAVRLHYLGLFYNNFMPGSVGGDLIRAWYVTKHSNQRFKAALSVFVDRVIGLLSTLFIAAFFYFLFLRGRGISIETSGHGGFLRSITAYKWIFLWILVGLTLVFFLFLFHPKSRVLLSRCWSNVIILIIKVIDMFKDAARLYYGKPLIILAACGLTVFLQVLTIAGFWFLGTDIGVTVSIKYYLVFFTLTWVLGVVPVSISGAVVVEGSLYYLFTHFAGVGKEEAVAIALCQRAIWMLASLPGAFIHLLGAHLPKDFFIDGTGPVD
jgi:uncharacterized protein (TIRG00374 family)